MMSHHLKVILALFLDVKGDELIQPKSHLREVVKFDRGGDWIMFLWIADPHVVEVEWIYGRVDMDVLFKRK